MVVPTAGTSYVAWMRIIARSTLVAFAGVHPEAQASIEPWFNVTKAATWSTTSEVQQAFSKAKVINAERVRFEISGGSYRLIAAFDFFRQIAFVKFIGTHADYDRVDAASISLF